jgi:quinol monooxygenase YgiN
MNRREFTFSTGVVAASLALKRDLFRGESNMYGLITKLRSFPGRRESLLSILIDGSTALSGCVSYIVAKDTADSDALWVTEVWIDAGSHKASLSTPSVQNTIAKAKPIIAGFGERFETIPVGGKGLNG